MSITDPLNVNKGEIIWTLNSEMFRKLHLSRWLYEQAKQQEYLELEPRMAMISETSYNEEMKKHTIRGKLFAIIGRNLNNRLAIYKW